MRPGILEPVRYNPRLDRYASMRPRPCGPGYLWHRRLSFPRASHASMRPRPCGPGYLRELFPVLRRTGFNEAQAMRPGIHQHRSLTWDGCTGFNEAQAMRPGIHHTTSRLRVYETRLQ